MISIVLQNTINLNKIHTLVEDDSDRFEKNGESVLINIKMVMFKQLSLVTMTLKL